MLWDSIAEGITNWIKGILISAIESSMQSLFSSVSTQAGTAAAVIGQSPSDAMGGSVLTLIQNISETVIMPIAGIILTFVACYELITMVTEHNNLANLDTWIFFKWVFKTAAAALIISNTFNIVMGVFDVSQYVIGQASGVISTETSVSSIDMDALDASLQAMDVGPLLGMLITAQLMQLIMPIISVVITVIIYARMIQIYLMVSLAPVPMATFGSHEISHVGKNFVRSLLALAFQGFLMLVCIGIYAMLLKNMTVSDDIIGYAWGVIGYSFLLIVTLIETGSISKSIFDAH
ncbi:VirB6/TrbL-like conjugal transfer protein, CD1112 family [Bilifractor sp. LCP19S3_H10]|uniref:VirB6/TrbL-like conjugal transfer protein, CD1112 family n=1 Tax=Bilifractor sp. LCP19S3_H10 TaxID=3438736 RepID=UPI003F936A90